MSDRDAPAPPRGQGPAAGDTTAAAARPARGEERQRSGLLAMVAGGLAVVLLAAAGAFTAYWFFAMATLEERVAGWIEQHQADAFRISHGRTERGGFPGRLRLSLPDGTISAPAGWSWSSPRTIVETRLLHPEKVTVRFEGDQVIRLPAAVGGDTLVARADRLEAAPAAGGWLPTGSLAATDLAVGSAGSAKAAHVARLEAVAAGDPGRSAGPDEGTYDVALLLQPLSLPEPAVLPLGGRIDRLAIEARLTGTLADRPWPEALERWRDAGGTIEVTRLAVDYGPLQMTGDGTLALDTAGEIVAAFAISAAGLGETLDALAARGMITPEVSAAARLLLREPGGRESGGDIPEAGAPGGGGGGDRPALRVPVSIQDRILYLGPLPIARLPAIAAGLSRR